MIHRWHFGDYVRRLKLVRQMFRSEYGTRGEFRESSTQLGRCERRVHGATRARRRNCEKTYYKIQHNYLRRARLWRVTQSSPDSCAIATEQYVQLAIADYNSRRGPESGAPGLLLTCLTSNSERLVKSGAGCRGNVEICVTTSLGGEGHGCTLIFVHCRSGRSGSDSEDGRFRFPLSDR